MQIPNIFATKPQETVATVVASFTDVLKRLEAVRERELQTAAGNRAVAEAALTAAVQNEAEAKAAGTIASKIAKILEV
jgi:hypothetical protein